MVQLVLHAGTVKTGTTYLQKTFYENRAVLERHGVSYPFVFPPDLHLPRYTNAHFLYNRSRDAEARKAILSAPGRIVLISEEGIFGNVYHLRHPAFEGVPKKVLLYVRPTADVLGAWAAEMSQPYNVAGVDFEVFHPTGRKLLPMDEAIKAASHEYAVSIGRFMEVVDEIGRENFILRPFERASFVAHDLLTDFFTCLDLDAAAVRADPEFRDPGPTNLSATRKFCDISQAVWHRLGEPSSLGEFNYDLVAAVEQACASGDERPVVETLTDAHIEWLTYRFEHFETYIARTFLDGQPLFRNRYPACYGVDRERYRPVDATEIDSLADRMRPRPSLDVVG
jgi:hypothetical protein